jgi:hypothetical protein
MELIPSSRWAVSLSFTVRSKQRGQSCPLTESSPCEGKCSNSRVFYTRNRSACFVGTSLLALEAQRLVSVSLYTVEKRASSLCQRRHSPVLSKQASSNLVKGEGGSLLYESIPLIYLTFGLRPQQASNPCASWRRRPLRPLNYKL